MDLATMLEPHVYKRLLKSSPWWLIVVNAVTALPGLLSPFVLCMSVFIFDNPSPAQVPLAILLFLAVNSYSFILLGVVWLSVTLHQKTKKWYLALCPQAALVALIFGIIYLVGATT